jgi:hypothetical protein
MMLWTLRWRRWTDWAKGIGRDQGFSAYDDIPYHSIVMTYLTRSRFHVVLEEACFHPAN